MKRRKCGDCLYWQAVGLGREDGHCEAPVPQWYGVNGERCSTRKGQKSDLLLKPNHAMRLHRETPDRGIE